MHVISAVHASEKNSRLFPTETRSGFTYVELLVALLILGLVGLVLVQAQVGIIAAQARVRQETAADDLASSIQSRHYAGLDATSIVDQVQWNTMMYPEVMMVNSNPVEVTVLKVRESQGRAQARRVLIRKELAPSDLAGREAGVPVNELQ